VFKFLRIVGILTLLFILSRYLPAATIEGKLIVFPDSICFIVIGLLLSFLILPTINLLIALYFKNSLFFFAIKPPNFCKFKFHLSAPSNKILDILK
jgi:hypothetical protein